MPFIGNQLSTSFQNVETQTITGDGSTSYTLNNAVADGKDLLVYINNVKQEEGSGKSYTATGTTITFTEAVASTDSCYVVFIGQAVGTVTPKDGSIVSSMLADANLEMPNTLDLNGKELILDADADTSITADTDDQIDFRAGGTDVMALSTTGATVSGTLEKTVANTSTNGGIAVNNGSYDAVAIGTGGYSVNGGTATDGGIRAYNNLLFASGSSSTERMRIDSSGNVLIGETSQINGGFLNLATSGASNALSFLVRSERARITSGGNISFGANTTSNIETTILMTMTGNGSHPDHYYEVGPHYTADTPSFYTINEAGTGVYLPHGNTSWSAHSDERIKENIISLGTVLPDIKNIRCVKYNLKGNSDTKIGFIAQDWESKFSEIVDENNSRQVIESDGSVSFDTESESTTKVKAMSYTETIPVLLKAIQELEERIATLESK